MKIIRNLTVASMLSIALPSSYAQVADTEYAFKIPEQSLASALLSLSEQADIVITVPPELVENKVAPTVDGTMPFFKALERLLVGSGLRYLRNSSGAITIVRSKSKERTDVKKSDAMGTAGLLEEIVVTATKREENLQDIAMSVNAFSGDRLRASGIHDVQDLSFLAAGIQISPIFSQPRVTIRGVGNNQITAGGESGVAVHRDGVYLAQRTDVGMGFFDVERIEVLRGPQGTLYGRNATGGAVNIISKAPTDQVEAGASITLGNYDLIETDGYISGPLSGDKLLARLAFKTQNNDGYTLNQFNGERLDNDDLMALRTITEYEAADNLRFAIMADYARDEGVTTRLATRPDPAVPITHEINGGSLAAGRKVNHDADTFDNKESWGISFSANWELSRIAIKSLTAYRQVTFDFSGDYDFTDGDFVSIRVDRESKQISQEFTLASTDEADLKWTAGMYYFHSNESELTVVPINTLSTTLVNDVPKLETDAYALFGEAEYPLGERWALSLGARYSYEERRIEQSSAISNGINFEQLEDDWGAFTPKAALTYELSNGVMAYATISQGFKSGSFNGGTLQGTAYDPEEVSNYEIGLKTSFWGGRFRANMSAFHMDYDDLQVRVRRINPQSNQPQPLVSNAATATIRGAELDLQAQVTDSLLLDSNVSYLDAIFEEWPDALDGNILVDVADNPLPNAPEWAVNFGVTHSIAVGNLGVVSLRAEYAYKSRVYFDPFKQDINSQAGFSLFNGRLTFENMDGRWQIAAWAKNIEDKEAASEKAYTVVTNPLLINLHPPRSYGITVGYKF